jgi:hypothetical protein
MDTGAQNSGHILQTDHEAAANRVGGHNILPNPLKSPSQIPMFSGAPNAPITDFNEALTRFKEDLSRSLESSLGVQIKPNRNAYHKSYPSS